MTPCCINFMKLNVINIINEFKLNIINSVINMTTFDWTQYQFIHLLYKVERKIQ